MNKDREKMLLDINRMLQDNQKEQLQISEKEALQISFPSTWVEISNKNKPQTIKDLLDLYQIKQIEIPSFDLNPVEHAFMSIRQEKLPVIDENVFAEWKFIDVPVMLLAGAAGAGFSYLLTDKFADLHDDNWAKKPAINGGHSGEIVDRVPGKMHPGGFGHRWEYGHDILNPFEIDLNDYFKGPTTNIPSLPSKGFPKMVKVLFYWMRHLIQDTFSKEGLPLPGHTLIRNWIEPLLKTPNGREILKILGTIKARDIAGASLTNVFMGAYLWGTEKPLSRLTVQANYRAFSLMAGANLTAILLGLLIPPPKTSFNWSCMPPLLYYGGRLVWMSHQIEQSLKDRNKMIESNKEYQNEINKNFLNTDNQLFERQKQLELNEKIINSHKISLSTIHAQNLKEFRHEDIWLSYIKKWGNIKNETQLIDIVANECLGMIKEK